MMVLLDNWTIVNAIIFVLGIVGYKFAFKQVRDRDGRVSPDAASRLFDTAGTTRRGRFS